MRHGIAAAGLWLACSFTALASDAPSSSLAFRASATVDVTADGHAHVVEMGEVTKLSEVPALAPIAEQVAQRLRDRIASWQFIPATRAGVAVSSRTNVSIALEAYDDGNGGLAIRIRDASTGASLRPIDKTPLRVAVTKAQSEGYVQLELAFDEGGHVTVRVKDTKALWHGQYSGVADKHLWRGALAAAQAWSIEPEVVDGKPQGGTGTISVVFCLDSGCDQVPLPRTPHSGGDPAQFASTDPAVMLRTAVAGTAL